MRITISQRVAIVLLISIGLLIALILVNGATVTRYRANAHTLATETLPAVENIATLRHAIGSVSEETLHYLITGDNEHNAARSAAALDLLRILAIMHDTQREDTVNAGEETTALDKVEAQARALLNLSDELATARRRSANVDLNAFADQLDKTHAGLDGAIDSFAALQRQERFDIVAAAEEDPLRITRVLAALALLMLIAQFVLSRLALFRPLLRLRDAALAVAAGDRKPIPVNADDEIGDLARAFNAMIARVNQQERSLEERAATLERANAAQRELLDTVRALDVPVIPVGAGVLALPLVGAVDAERAAELTQRLLATVHTERATTVLLDVTGLAGADANTARYLLDTAQQLRLLGARAIVTGIRAELAYALANLDLDLRTVEVRATLREGIAEALNTTRVLQLAAD